MADPVLLNTGDVTFTAYPGTTIHVTVQDPPPPPPPPVPDPNAMPVGNLKGWRQIYAEDFTRPAVLGQVLSVYGGTLSAYPKPWTDTTGHGEYDPGILEVDSSVLRAHLGWNPATKRAVVSCVGPILPGGSAQTGQLYHRHAVRFRVLPPSDPAELVGLKIVWLLWPDKKQVIKITSVDGELDWPEASLNQTMHAYTHYTKPNPLGTQQAFDAKVPMTSGWHIAETVWQPGSVEYFLDGRRVGVSAVFTPVIPMHLDLQMESSTDGQLPGPKTKAIVEIDWLVVYAYAPDPLPPAAV